MATLRWLLQAFLETGKIPVDSRENTIIRPAPARTKRPALVPRAWKRKAGRATNMIESFYHAFHGIWIGMKEERNVRIHFFSALLVIALAVWLNVDLTGWALLALATGLVLTAEFLNTSLEHLVNITADEQYHEQAKYAKDTAAAAVLCASMMALVVGLTVFIPRLLPRLIK